MTAAGRRLVGRTEEVDHLERALAPGARGRAVVLGGAAGVGKTRLAREVADRWVSAGRPVEWVSGTPGSSAIPFGAVARLLEDVAASPEGMSPRDAEVIRASVAAATALPERLVVIDDGHSLDELSALLVHHLVLARACAVLITIRSGEHAPQALVTLWRDQHAERVDLQPLSRPEATELAVAVLDGDVEDATAASLFDASEGNPLLLDAIVRDALETGALRDVGGTWRADGDIALGRHLRDVLRSRVRSLGDPGLRLLAALAVAEPLSRTLLRRLAPDVALDEAEARGLVAVRSSQARMDVQLAHPLLGEVVRQEVDDAWLDGVRADVADAIATTGGRRAGDVLLEATLRLDAGAPTSSDLLLAAARQALHFGDSDLGGSLVDAAIAAGAPPMALVMKGEVLLVTRRNAEALAAFESAVDAIDDTDPLVRTASALQHLPVAPEDEPRADALVERIKAKVDDPIWKAVIEGNAIQRLMMAGSTREAWRRGEALLAANEDPRVLLRLASSVGSGRALVGRTQESRELVNELFPIALQHAEALPLGTTWVMNAQAIALVLGGHLEEGLGLVSMLRSMLGATHGAVDVGAWLDLFEGRLLLSAGRMAEAEPKLACAVDAFGEDDIGGFGRWAAHLHGEVLALLGEIDAARAIAARADQQSSRTGIYDGDALRSRAWVTALGGQLQRAIEDLLDIAALQQLEEQRALEINTLHDVVRLGGVAEAGGRLLELAEVCDGSWPAPMAAHVRGLQSGSGAELEAAGEGFAEMGSSLMAAECMAEAARAHEAAGLRTRVAGALRRRDELLGACGAVRTPALQDLPARVGLTRREREVVELAAQGLSNKEIADRLFVSLRTAEGHLYRAFGKLGVDDRADLPGVLRNA